VARGGLCRGCVGRIRRFQGGVFWCVQHRLNDPEQHLSEFHSDSPPGGKGSLFLLQRSLHKKSCPADRCIPTRAHTHHPPATPYPSLSSPFPSHTFASATSASPHASVSRNANTRTCGRVAPQLRLFRCMCDTPPPPGTSTHPQVHDAEQYGPVANSPQSEALDAPVIESEVDVEALTAGMNTADTQQQQQQPHEQPQQQQQQQQQQEQ